MLFFKYNFEGEKKNQQIRIHSFPTANLIYYMYMYNYLKISKQYT